MFTVRHDLSALNSLQRQILTEETDQPTYYHFHIHIVHVALEAGATQAVGKALSLNNIVSQLATMAGDDNAGMDAVDLTYTLGEASELWTDIFLPLKEGRKPSVP